jgi:hypothetical protein
MAMPAQQQPAHALPTCQAPVLPAQSAARARLG